MYNAVKNGNNMDYNFKRFICDKIEDKDAIDVGSIAPGSTALVIETKEEYILTNAKEWKFFTKYSDISGGVEPGDEYLTIGEIASVAVTTEFLEI